MQKIKVSEIFGPHGYYNYDKSGSSTFIERYGVTQGEGKHVGTRSTFLRTFGCNLTCPSFGLSKGEKTLEPDLISRQIDFYSSINDLPAAKFGCDSYFSWHPKFKHLSPTMDTEAVAKQILDCTGGSFFHQPHSPVHLVITGGEPLLGWQRAYCELIAELRKQDTVWNTKTYLKLPVTFETNGTQPLMKLPQLDRTVLAVDSLIASGCELTWSISPKLSNSGHDTDETIRPDIVASYMQVDYSHAYFKFVIHDVSELDEVDAVVKQYQSAGVFLPVYIMPEGGTQVEFAKHSTVELVAESVKRGYNITPRLHVMIGGNAMAW